MQSYHHGIIPATEQLKGRSRFDTIEGIVEEIYMRIIVGPHPAAELIVTHQPHAYIGDLLLFYPRTRYPIRRDKTIGCNNSRRIPRSGFKRKNI